MNDQQLRQWIQINLAVIPKDLNLYKKAITTRQYEALEFFGDSIIGFLVSEYLIKNCLIDQPGYLTEARKELVKDTNLSLIAQKINLVSVVVIPSTSSKVQITDRVLADVVEALVGAIYLDQGITKCREVIFKIFNLEQIASQYISKVPRQTINLLDIDNPISALQELLAKYGISPPQYFDIARRGYDNAPIFTIRATCTFRGQYLTVDGTGGSKKEAKKNASHKLLSLVISL